MTFKVILKITNINKNFYQNRFIDDYASEDFLKYPLNFLKAERWIFLWDAEELTFLITAYFIKFYDCQLFFDPVQIS